MPRLHSSRPIHVLPKHSRLVRLGFLLLILATVMCAQSTTADVLGTITDASGGVLPGVKVTVHNLATGADYLGTSDAGGNYAVTLLPVGRYSVTVAQPGFKTWTVPGVTLAIGDRPNAIGDPTTGFTQSPSAWFNTKAFAAQPANTYGNLGRNVLHAPGRTSLDLAIHREFTPREGMHLQFRFETFNLTNTPPFAAPNAGFGNANCGTITSAGLPRNVQVALKLLF